MGYCRPHSLPQECYGGKKIDRKKKKLNNKEPGIGP